MKARVLSVALVARVVVGLTAVLLAQQQDTTATKSRLQDRVFQSESLRRAMKYRILLPKDYFETSRSYPVLYLLHGWHGEYQNWSTLTKLAYYAESLPLIVIMPDAGDSWYVDSATSAQDKFEQYVIDDLIEEVDRHWRTLRCSRRRAIAGLSMGGYGAVKFALKYPDIFQAAASISGAFNAASPELGNSRSDLQPSLMKAFDEAHSKTREQNDLFSLAASARPQSTAYLYIDCGNQDSSFLEPNRRFVSLLSQRNFAYEYHEYPGAHTWQYWDERLSAVLRVVQQQIVEAISR